MKDTFGVSGGLAWDWSAKTTVETDCNLNVVLSGGSCGGKRWCYKKQDYTQIMRRMQLWRASGTATVCQWGYYPETYYMVYEMRCRTVQMYTYEDCSPCYQEYAVAYYGLTCDLSLMELMVPPNLSLLVPALKDNNCQ